MIKNRMRVDASISFDLEGHLEDFLQYSYEIEFSYKISQ